MDIAIVSSMSEHDLSCVVIEQNTDQQQKLLQVLRAGEFNIHIELASDVTALRALLTHQTMALFYSVPEGETLSEQNEQKLLRLLLHISPDCILVCITDHSSQSVASVELLKNGAAHSGETCTIATDDDAMLRQQLNYLFAYARLKTKFRQCKHLLSVAELRSQWLLENTREAVAYIVADRHIHLNTAYLSLFGLNSIVDAQAVSVLSLVQSENQSVFNAVKREAEKHTQPSNKLLLTLNTAHGSHFRAEVRFIPAVYRGQRCVQLHVHPLLQGNARERISPQAMKASDFHNNWHEGVSSPSMQAYDFHSNAHERISPQAMKVCDFHSKQRTQWVIEAQPEPAENRSANPWHEPSESARQLQQQVKQQIQEGRSNEETDMIPTVLDDDAVSQLQPAFTELLNLRGENRSALLFAQPWLQYTNVARLDYAQLLNNAHDDTARFRLDYRTLQLAFDFLTQQEDSPVQQQVVVHLGNWALTDVKQVAQLLKLLKKFSKLNKQLVLGLDSATCLRRQKAVKALLPLYAASGAQLMFENVRHVDEKLLALLDLSSHHLIQIHESYAREINADTGIPEVLHTLLQQMSERGVVTVVSGVQDIHAMNLLCATTATYLQGPILEKLSR